MTSSVRRPWFRFHLSVAIVMTLVAGSLMWLNLRPPTILKLEKNYDNKLSNKLTFEWSGWPLHGPNCIIINRNASHYIPEERVQIEIRNHSTGQFYSYWTIVSNLSIGLAVVFSVALLSELLLRRREARMLTREN